MLCVLNNLRHVVKSKVSFGALLNELSLRRTNRPREFVRTKVLSKVELELWLSIQCPFEERGGYVEECLSQDRGSVGSSLTRGTALCP